MEECSLDLIFLIRDKPFGYQVRGGAAYFQQFKLEFIFRYKVKAFIFCSHKKYFYNCYEALHTSSLYPLSMCFKNVD